jgi:hypothetical protein
MTAPMSGSETHNTGVAEVPHTTDHVQNPNTIPYDVL